VVPVVYKYDLPLPDTYTRVRIQIHSVGIFLKAGILPGNHLYVWYLVDNSTPKVNVDYRIIGTGDVLHEKQMRHLETIFHGAYVWHLFLVPGK